MIPEKGLIHVYTGDGKGKTSAACGLAMRVWGQGGRVLVVQFMKNGQSGELRGLRALGEGVEVRATDDPDRPFIWNQTADQRSQAREENRRLFTLAAKALSGGNFDLIVLDEILSAIRAGDVTETDVVEWLVRGKGKCELVVTGRDAPQAIREVADYVSVIGAEKHPFRQGIPARKGIEY